MVPKGFSWQSITGMAGHGPRDALTYRRCEVARVTDRIDGGWLALLHYPDGRRVVRHCTSYEAGRAGCAVWALRHEAALRAHIDRRLLEWLAHQTWRGEDAARARCQLEARPD